MTTVFEKLKSLQDILSKRFELEREIYEIPKALTTKTEIVNRLKKSFIEKNEKLEKTREKMDRLKTELAETEEQREKYEKQYDQAQTQREWEALEKEIKDTKEKELNLRKDIVREEKYIEDLNISLQKEESMISLQETELKKEQEKIQLESKSKEAELKKLKTEEQHLVPGMDEEIIFKFERIIKSKSGLGIVGIKEGICSGCHMVLPAQYVNDVRKSEKILFCPYCSRILFFESSSAIVEREFADEDEGALSDVVDVDDSDFDLED
jgi:predicted  nucleic acid-binding Zn-ribbon protein